MSDNEVFVANGELAEVIEVHEKYFVARLSGPTRVIRVPRGQSAEPEELEIEESSEERTGCSWELGYCLSVHKFQGSESPWAIVVGDEYPGAKMVCDRSWLYTAISRAKSRCVLVGRRAVFDSMCRKQSLKNRKTLLRERILLEIAKCELATI